MQEEKDIIEYIENGNARSVENLDYEKTRFQNMAKAYASKKKAINIRLPESDIYILKQKSLESGLLATKILYNHLFISTHKGR